MRIYHKHKECEKKLNENGPGTLNELLGTIYHEANEILQNTSLSMTDIQILLGLIHYAGNELI